GFAFVEQLDRLVGRNLALQNRASDPDAIWIVFRHDRRHVVGLLRLVDLNLAAIGERGLAEEIVVGKFDRRVVVLLKDKVDLKLIVELQGCVEGFVKLRLKAGQRTNELLAEKFYRLVFGERASCNVFLGLKL